MLAWLIPLIVVIALAGATILIYNRLVRLRNRTDNAWSQVRAVPNVSGAPLEPMLAGAPGS